MREAVPLLVLGGSLETMGAGEVDDDAAGRRLEAGGLLV
jgi:hypothetical protein